MKKKYNWAILGCGHIAEKFSSDLTLLPNANLYATASRSLEKSTQFANDFGFEKAYGSYKEMVNDLAIDIIYIATPHSHHLEHTLLCLNHKKAVLCEKAFAINSKEVEQMITASKENNTFLMEAFWTNFDPKFLKVLEIIDSNKLGTLKFVKSDFMFNGAYDPQKRLYNVSLGGGSLLDIGIYPVFTVLKTLGKPNQIKTITHFSPTTSEESISILFGYQNGNTAILSSSFASTSANETEFCFENGYIKISRDSKEPIIIYDGKNTEELFIENGNGWGYHFEAAHVMECLDKNQIQSKLLPLSFSLDLMNILDEIRKDAGIIFPNHD